jgi:hypothetical protein
MTTATEPLHRTPLRRLPLRLAVAAAGALFLNLLTYLTGSLLGASWTVSTPQVIGVGMVIGATILPLALAGVVVWALASRWPALPRWSAWAGLAFGLLTIPMSLLSAADSATGISLAAMHAVTAVAWLLAVLPARSNA